MANLFIRLAAAFRGDDFNAATLTPPPLPKGVKGGATVPSYRTQVVARASAIPKPTAQTQTLDRVATMRQQTSEYDAIRFMAKASPELGSGISTLLRVAIPSKYFIFGRDLDGQIDREVTELAHELLRRLTFLGAADGSFGSQQGLQTLSETLAIDGLLSGAMAMEVALDKASTPASFNPVGVKTLTFYEEENSFRIVQKVGGVEIDLDIPTFIYVPFDQVVTEAYPTSPLSAAVQAVISDLDFNNDMRKALKRAVLPRLMATIDSERLAKLTPPEILADPEQFAQYQNSVITAIQSVVNSLEPEDALISFDTVNYSYVDGGHDPSTIIEKVQKVLNAKLTAGVRSMPVTLGFASTAQASSTESMLFLKQADGVRKKLNELYSRALTTAVRLMGKEGYVEFEFETLNLRPESELEAFRSMEQDRILQLLSLGMLTDDEAAIRLTGKLPPKGAPQLSGTMFHTKSGTSGNPTSNTSAQERRLKSDSPDQPKD